MSKKTTETELENEETRRRAYLICLSEPINNSIYDISLQTENLIDILKKAKSKEDFDVGLTLLKEFCDNQEKLIVQLKKILLLTNDKQNQEPVQKVH